MTKEEAAGEEGTLAFRASGGRGLELDRRRGRTSWLDASEGGPRIVLSSTDADRDTSEVVEFCQREPPDDQTGTAAERSNSHQRSLYIFRDDYSVPERMTLELTLSRPAHMPACLPCCEDADESVESRRVSSSDRRRTRLPSLLSASCPPSSA